MRRDAAQCVGADYVLKRPSTPKVLDRRAERFLIAAALRGSLGPVALASKSAWRLLAGLQAKLLSQFV